MWCLPAPVKSPAAVEGSLFMGFPFLIQGILDRFSSGSHRVNPSFKIGLQFDAQHISPTYHSIEVTKLDWESSLAPNSVPSPIAVF